MQQFMRSCVKKYYGANCVIGGGNHRANPDGCFNSLNVLFLVF
jgi:hypothetical protein